jgi:hypothetical protein
MSLSGTVNAEEYGVQLTSGPDRTGGADAALFFWNFFAPTSCTEQGARKTGLIESRTTFGIAQAFFKVLFRVFDACTFPVKHLVPPQFVFSTKCSIAYASINESCSHSKQVSCSGVNARTQGSHEITPT